METSSQAETRPESIASGVSNPTTTKRKRLHRQAAIPKELRAEITQYARTLAKKYRHLFRGDRQMKDRTLRLVRALLPPRPRRRGRPGSRDVTRAISLLRRFRRQFSEETRQQHWARVYAVVIPDFHSMIDVEQETARFALRERVRWRMRKRRGKIRS